MGNRYLRYRSFLILLILAIGLAAPVQAAQGVQEDWQSLAPGIDYQEFQLRDPNHLYVARMDRSTPDTTLETSIALGKLTGALETIPSQAARYDGAINFWGDVNNRGKLFWGDTNHVVVAINGSYKDSVLNIPDRGMVQSGWYAKRFADLENGSGFGWTLDRDAFIGECVNHTPSKQQVTYVRTGNTQPLDGVNIPRPDDELIVYTPQYDRDTGTDATGVEVLVEMSRPALLLALPNMVTGTVQSVYTDSGETPIPFDHVVLSANGAVGTALANNVQQGDVIGISQEIKSYEADCHTALKIDWTKTYASLGGGFYFLKDGSLVSQTDPGALVRSPRTAIAFNDQYIYFIVVDGRDPIFSAGMNMEELGIFARDTLSATYAISEDGGGSSTMVVNGQVVNNTYCNDGFCRYPVLLPMLLRNDGAPQVAQSQASMPEMGRRPRLNLSPDLTAARKDHQRAVVNGMMMVMVEPITRSVSLAADDVVTTTLSTDIRLGPGTNYAVLDTLPQGAVGVVLPNKAGLDGVLAKGLYWWRVKFGPFKGWVPETSLQLPPSSP